MPDAALKDALESLSRNYRYALIDSPAGLEHLNRKITAHVSDIFDVMGPSNKSFEHVKRAYRIATEIGIEFTRFYVVGGCLFPEGLKLSSEEKTGQPYLGKIDYDPMVQEAVMAGRSLLDLPEDSPVVRSIRQLMERAGY
jgi:CO dehydrogenase maturation factor